MSTKVSSGEYAAKGLVGLGVPQANPTVEQESFALRPDGISIVTSRLTSSAPDIKQRLLEYIERTPDYAGQFDDLKIDCFGIACTGSSYLLGAEREAELMQTFTAELGYPVITAAMAIDESLTMLGARTIGIVSPYPDWLAEQAEQYWSTRGYSVQELRSVPMQGANIHSIYALSSADAIVAALQLPLGDIDAVLFTGTGMPSLGAINQVARHSGIPVMSSNLCLLTALARRLNVTNLPLLQITPGLDTRTL